MKQGDNNSSHKMKKAIILSAIALILLIIPFILQPFNDRYTQLLKEQFPYLDLGTSSLTETLQKQIKLPFYLSLETDKYIYKPYEPIKVQFLLTDKESGIIISNLNPTLEIFDADGKTMENIAQETEFIMDFLPSSKVYQKTILLNDVYYEGSLTVKISFEERMYSQEITEEVLISVQKPKAKFALPNNYAFLGLDSKEIMSSRNILSIDSEEVGISGLSQWFALLNNNAVLIPSAITKTFSSDDSSSVWDEEKLKESLTLAREFSRQGIDTALWIQALEIEGLDIQRFSYQYAMPEKEKETGRTVISLKDEKRKEELVTILKEHMVNNDINYVGLEKIFFPDYKIYDEFSSNSSELSQSALANVEQKWKQYQIVRYYREIFSKIEHNKPLFMNFTGEDLSAHPEFIQMAFATGVDFIFVDIGVSIENLPTQIALLDKSAIKNYPSQVILSYCLDFNNLVSGQGSAVNNWIEQSLALYHHYDLNTIYVKDFYRAMFGNRGPYPAYEWVIAVGDLISKWKNSKSIYALDKNILVDKSEVAEDMTLTISFKNVSKEPLYDVSLTLMPVIENGRSNILQYPVLKEGEVFRTNLSLKDIRFKQSLLQKKTRFIALESSYSTKNITRKKTNTQVELISFIDPKVKEDQVFSTDDDFNEQMRAQREEELRKKEEEKKRIEALEQQQLLEQLRQEAETNNDQEEMVEEDNEDQGETEDEETSKKSWWERRKDEKES